LIIVLKYQITNIPNSKIVYLKKIPYHHYLSTLSMLLFVGRNILHDIHRNTYFVIWQ